MHTTRRGSSKSSLIKSVVFLALLVVGFIGVSRISRFGLPSQAASLINIDTDVSQQKISQIPEQQQDSLRKSFAGFWVSEIISGNEAVRKTDHLELRDNGIIWQVINWFITFPSGDTLSMYLARNAYLIPYGKHDGKKGYACDVRVIRQTFIVGTDTCYGPSQQDELWLVEKTSQGIKFNGREFVSYDGELVEFFPDSMIDLVDKLLVNGCVPGASLQKYAHMAISEQLEKLAPVAYKEEITKQWIKHYYTPLMVDDLLHSQLHFSIPDSVTIAFTVSADGKVTASTIKSGDRGRVNSLLLQNINSWIFPKHTLTEKAPKIVHTFHFPD